MKSMRKTMCLLMCAALMAASLSSLAFAERFEYEAVTAQFNGHTYQVLDLPMTWTDSRDYCNSLGGHLVTITSEEEEAFIESILREDGQHQYWIGLDYTAGPLEWVTGEEITYTNWDNGMPDHHVRYDGAKEEYIHLQNVANPHVGGSRRFSWNDMYNDNTYPGEESNFSLEFVGMICEWDNHIVGDIDFDGELSNTDLVTIARYIVDLYTPGYNTARAVVTYADTNGDGVVDNFDIVVIARRIVGLE